MRDQLLEVGLNQESRLRQDLLRQGTRQGIRRTLADLGMQRIGREARQSGNAINACRMRAESSD